MASKQTGRRSTHTGPAPTQAKRSGSVTKVGPAPKLTQSPRKQSAPLDPRPAHVAPKKATVSEPVRASAPKSPPKTLSPVLPHTAPSQPVLSGPQPGVPAPEKSIWQQKAEERAAKAKASPPPVDSAPKAAPTVVQAKPATPRPAPKPKSVPDTVIERGYPLGFSSEKEFRDATRPMAKLARDGVVFVSGSSVTGVSYGRKNSDGTPAKFGKTSDIDVGIASPRLREDATQVQQSGKGKAFPVKDSALDNTRGRTRERHPIGAKVFYDVPSERRVLVRSHTPEGLRTDG